MPIRNKIRNPAKGNQRGKNKFTTKIELNQVNWEKVEKIFTSDKQIFLKNLKTKTIINPYTKDILKLLAGGAVLGLSLVFPTLPMALAPLIISRNKFDNNYFSQSIERMRKQKLVEIVEEGDQTLVRITQEGRVRALRYKLSEIQVKKPKVWDKKWRIVIFDIPEKYKKGREIFRDSLKVMGFYMLQKSVWVHPYPCFDEIEFIRQIYKVEINVAYIVAEKIESVEDLKLHFQLT